MASMRTTGNLSRLLVLPAVGAVLLASCAPAGPAASVQGNAPPTLKTTRTLRIDNNKETSTGIGAFTTNNGNQREVAWIFHAGLTMYDTQGDLVGRLARKVPSIADGDWNLNPDGTMDVTWRLRPNVKWHDGAPLVADDFVFGLQVARDPELPVRGGGGVRLIQNVTTPDAETFVVRWAEPFFGANQGSLDHISAVPRRIVGDLYKEGDKQSFANSPYWTTQFVGLGPYRMGEWAQGSFTEGLAFDDYFLGRPKIDRLIIRYINDSNVALASLLAGDIDETSNLTTQDLVTVKGAWGAEGGSIIYSVGGFNGAMWQWRVPSAPWVVDPRVRQAFMHLLDRQTLADNFEPDGGGPQDLFAFPGDAIYRLVQQRGYTRYAYDPARAGALLADAGWNRGPDGLLRDRTGTPFDFEVRSNGDLPLALAAEDMWKRGGVSVRHYSVPSNAVDRMKQRATMQGARFPAAGPQITDDLMVQFTTAQIQGEANNWTALNASGHSNPERDRLYAQYAQELDLAKRNSYNADFVKQIADEVLQIPVYYSATSTVFRRGVRGPVPSQPNQPAAWNIEEWDVD